MSPREDVAQELMETCIFGGLNEVYGCDRERRKDGKGKSYWSVTFCKSRITDGEVRVYSPKFILVRWQTAIRSLPRDGQEKFSSVSAAKQFIVQNFVRNQ